MQRLNRGAGSARVPGPRGAQAAAQEVPEQARKEIAHNLQGPFAVFRDVVQEDLKLTAEQKEKVEEHLRERLPDIVAVLPVARWRDWGGGPARKNSTPFRRQAAGQVNWPSVLKATLKADQSKRLRQLGLQQEGAFALFHGAVKIAKDLKITQRATEAIHGGRHQDLQKKVEPLIQEVRVGRRSARRFGARRR